MSAAARFSRSATICAYTIRTCDSPPMETATIALESQAIMVERGSAIQVTAALPEDLDALLPTEFRVADPDLWEINDFKIYQTSQLATREAVPAAALGTAIKPGGCDAIQRRMEFSMIATYLGDGQRPFRCEITGPAARH